MSRFLATVAVFAAVFACAAAASCESPKIDLKYFTTGDATIVSQIALIGEFTLDCADSSATGLALFAEFEGRITPVARLDSNKYQVSEYDCLGCLDALCHISKNVPRLVNLDSV